MWRDSYSQNASMFGHTGPRHRGLRLTTNLATDKRQLEACGWERSGRAGLKESLGQSTGQGEWICSFQGRGKTVRCVRSHPPRQMTWGARGPRAGFAYAVKRTPSVCDSRPFRTTAAISAALECGELKEVPDSCKHGSAPVKALSGVLHPDDKVARSSHKNQVRHTVVELISHGDSEEGLPTELR